MSVYAMLPPGLERLIPFLGLVTVLQFFAAVVLLAMYIRHRRFAGLLAAAPLLALEYFLAQCVMIWAPDILRAQWVMAASAGLASLPPLLLALLFAAPVLAEVVLFRDVLRYERTHITGMSVKEATDSLPMGLCFYIPGGKVLMVNRAMEDFCRSATGEALINGERFCERLHAGELLPGCESIRTGETPMVVLPDGTAWSVSLRETPYEETKVRMLFAYDVTEDYRKTEELREMQREVSALNARLAAYNQELVALATQREILNARVRIHDELGRTLLSLKRYILAGGTAQELAELRSRLGQSVSFVRAERLPAARDEYDLMLETAETLGVHVHLTGALPQTEPNKHILATALHECITNTLRHAHGDAIHISCAPTGDTIAAVFTNNGEQPQEEIREKGGLRTLRAMTEKAGGTMTVRSVPSFSITLELPKEVRHVI